MKSVVVETRVKRELDYPCLMKAKSNGFIVLFTNVNTGVIIDGKNIWSIGHYSKNWPEGLFEVFEGSITLSND